jgi:predicted component of type VI protein secretion system
VSSVLSLNSDRCLLSKFSSCDATADSDNSLHASILEEVENILSSRRRLARQDGDACSRAYNPFVYGIIDLQSIDCSKESVEYFKDHCKNAILDLEPRLEYIVIHDINFLHESQQLVMTMTFLPRHAKESFTGEVRISHSRPYSQTYRNR